MAERTFHRSTQQEYISNTRLMYSFARNIKKTALAVCRGFYARQYSSTPGRETSWSTQAAGDREVLVQTLAAADHPRPMRFPP
jgi:hypothetical protein